SLAFAQLQSGLQLKVFLEDGLGFDHPLEHRLALALQLRVLVCRVPVIAGAGEQPFGRRDDLMQGSGDWASDVEGGSSDALERLGRNHRKGEENDADDDAGNDRQEAEK